MTTGPLSGPQPGPLSGPELLVELRRGSRRPLRAQLEEGLRDAVRGGRLAPQSRMPSTRTLAADLGVSRRLVVEAYAQLLAEGYLRAAPGAGTFVAAAPRPSRAARDPAGRAQRGPRLDFFAGSPALELFPRREWQRAMRSVLAGAPDRALAYPDPRGAGPLRRALADHLGRVRGVAADPGQILICSGAIQALALLADALSRMERTRFAVEDPSLPPHREALRRGGLELVALTVDADGARTDELSALDVHAALLTPAHQFPLGVALSPPRRAAALEWAAGGGLLIEDDYDAEFRFDRAPLGALQGLAPDRVIYLGTASKSLAPALRLAWMVIPRGELAGRLAEAKAYADGGSPTLDQLALAQLLESGDYDRHLRKARRHYRARRDALVAALARHVPDARVEGIAAGLGAIARLPYEFDGEQLMMAAAERDVGVYPLGPFAVEPSWRTDALHLGYAGLGEGAIEEGIRRLAEALAEVRGR
ncbi:MAG TPA: PLP-dependent aminotransferase family protein [Solirubrobacteraceae bacterium]|nr:PLP-dependent aminotransferase family protein [Solirubrobacteraceae bacterium]